MNVKRAKTAGFCFGVKRAVETVYEQAKNSDAAPIYTYGPIIHNEEVVKDLENQGVIVLRTEQELEQLKHLFGQLRPEFKEYVLKELQNLLELQDKADAYRRTK